MDQMKEKKDIQQANLQSDTLPSTSYPPLVTNSSAMQKIVKDLEKIGKSQASVFITGESGTGKEVIANAIHRVSLRRNASFIKVNCAAIPEALMESEFFGHEKGAFTGAMNRKEGRFEWADKGTLLLDEVTEIPITLQPKLLRAIQEQEFERVGGLKSIKVNVRFIATSNRNMKEAIEQKIFREDLYYRLNVVPIHIPPLRERSEDILPLANYFLTKFCLENQKEPKILDKSAIEKLLNHHWPGNVRELANIMERTIVLNASPIICAEHLHLTPMSQDFANREAANMKLYIGNERCTKDEVTNRSDLPQEREKWGLKPIENELVERNTTQPGNSSTTGNTHPTIASLVGLSLAEIEKQLILETLKMCKHHRTKTANILKISVRTLRNKLHEYTSRDSKIGDSG